MPILLTAILVILGLGLVWLVYALVWGTPPSINLAVERLGMRMVLDDPELLTQIGLLDNTILDFHSGRLTDVSPRADMQRRRMDRDGLALIRRFSKERLRGQKRITYLLMYWYFEQNLRGHRYDYHWYANPVFMGPYPVNHVFGVHVDLIQFLSKDHKIRGRRSLRRYLKRLYQIDWKITGLQRSLQLRVEAGAVPPDFVLEKCLVQISNFLSKPIEENPLYFNVIEKMAESGRLTKRAQERWALRIKNAIEDAVKPAYRGLAATLKSLTEHTTDGDGVWRLPNGEDYYAFLLRQHTTTDLTAADIHQIGLDEVAYLTQSVQKILGELGLPTENPGKIMQSLQQDPQYQHEGDEARTAIINEYQTILDEVNQRMDALFNHGPLEEIAVKRLPEFKEPDSPIAYAQPPAFDGSRPGTLWLNLRDPKNIYRWGMRTLAYHEGVPGHVYQMSQAQKLKGLPTFRRMYHFNAYTEGWALYAEYLGWALGLEDRHAMLSNLGRLQALLWRAVRLVVDTGIHAMRWSRQAAIDYMIEKTGLPERDVITEVERYIVMPGQACAYYLGYLELFSLRKKAESILGEAFDIKAFHDVVINNGGLPLPLLAQVVNEYIDQTAGLKPIET